MRCSRAKEQCGHLHPREWYSESKILLADPWKMRFTHNHISSKFRCDTSVDDTIDQIRREEVSFDVFPPMEVFRLTKAVLDDDDVIRSILEKFEIDEGSTEASKTVSKLRASVGEVFSLSNRRLYVARVLKSFGLMDRVRIQEYDFMSERVQRTQRTKDDDEGQARWLQALSTDNMGWSVDIHSKYRGFEEPAHVAHSFELQEAATEVDAVSIRRKLRTIVCAKLDVERIPSCVFAGADFLLQVDFCIPIDSLAAVEDINVPSMRSNIGERSGARRKEPKVRNHKEQILSWLASQGGCSSSGKGKGRGKKGGSVSGAAAYPPRRS